MTRLLFVSVADPVFLRVIVYKAQSPAESPATLSVSATKHAAKDDKSPALLGATGRVCHEFLDSSYPGPQKSWTFVVLGGVLRGGHRQGRGRLRR